MAKTIVVAGYGPGVSAAVAEKFGAEGFQVGLVGRSADKLAAGVKALEAKGVKAAGFTADLGDPAAIRAMVEKVRGATELPPPSTQRSKSTPESDPTSKHCCATVDA